MPIAFDISKPRRDFIVTVGDLLGYAVDARLPVPIFDEDNPFASLRAALDTFAGASNREIRLQAREALGALTTLPVSDFPGLVRFFSNTAEYLRREIVPQNAAEEMNTAPIISLERYLLPENGAWYQFIDSLDSFGITLKEKITKFVIRAKLLDHPPVRLEPTHAEATEIKKLLTYSDLEDCFELPFVGLRILMMGIGVFQNPHFFMGDHSHWLALAKEKDNNGKSTSVLQILLKSADYLNEALEFICEHRTDWRGGIFESMQFFVEATPDTKKQVSEAIDANLEANLHLRLALAPNGFEYTTTLFAEPESLARLYQFPPLMPGLTGLPMAGIKTL